MSDLTQDIPKVDPFLWIRDILAEKEAKRAPVPSISEIMQPIYDSQLEALNTCYMSASAKEMQLLLKDAADAAANLGMAKDVIAYYEQSMDFEERSPILPQMHAAAGRAFGLTGDFLLGVSAHEKAAAAFAAMRNSQNEKHREFALKGYQLSKQALATMSQHAVLHSVNHLFKSLLGGAPNDEAAELHELNITNSHMYNSSEGLR